MDIRKSIEPALEKGIDRLTFFQELDMLRMWVKINA